MGVLKVWDWEVGIGMCLVERIVGHPETILTEAWDRLPAIGQRLPIQVPGGSSHSEVVLASFIEIAGLRL